jgi:hypothetical protein
MATQSGYTLLLYDGSCNDFVAYRTTASTPAQARRNIAQFYKEQGWEPSPPIFLVKRDRQGTFKVGSTFNTEAATLPQQVRVLCEALYNEADGSEYPGHEERLRAFLAQFEIGRAVLVEKDREQKERQEAVQASCGEQKMNDLPIIEHPEMRTGLTHCSACGGMGAALELKSFAIKTSETSQDIVAYCKECSEKIALFLIRAWDNSVYG